MPRKNLKRVVCSYKTMCVANQDLIMVYNNTVLILLRGPEGLEEGQLD